jgi:nicotinate phosphoribosyltransferase
MQQGKQTIDIPTVQQSAEYAQQRLRNLQKDHKRFENPHVYKVGISTELQKLRDDLIEKMKV